MSSHRISSVHRLITSLAIAAALPTAGAKASNTLEAAQATKNEAARREVTQGALRIIAKDGSIVECPLKHTDVEADVSGFIARVRVTQTFYNPTSDTIEAVYVFPLPHGAAVDAMTMQVGDRNIVGVIKRREEARQIYEQALMQGQAAALLQQERPNIFTQSVGNIAPQQEVKIQISYVDVLIYDMGEYEFHFPMVVGPRFIPGAPIRSPNPTPPELRGKVSPPVPITTRVPDAERITPPVLRPEVRNGHDISLTLSLDAAVPVQDVRVANHDATIDRDGDRKATVTLSPADSLPNKDFVVRYAVVGEKPEMAVLAHTGTYTDDDGKMGSGYFMLMIQPKEDERLKKSPPREMVFLVDVSGSMRGEKTDKTREMMRHMLGLCRDNDTVQVVTFASQAEKLFERPVPVDEASIRRALDFAGNLRGSGGTHMLQGVTLAIDEPIDKERVRIIVMLTDGFIGNEAEIIEHVGKNCGDQIRFWTIGIGQSPNMFLIDGVARQGGGMGQRLGLNDESESLSHQIMTRIQRAQLANVSIDWGSMQALETYPARIPELWAGRPVILFGRYGNSGRHEIAVSGSIEGESARWPMTVELPETQADHDVLAKVWARKKIEDLMHQTFYAESPAVEEEVTALALDYGLMSQYTSFVAVDEKDAEQQQSHARPPRRMLVPVPLPEGAQWEGFFGEHDQLGDKVTLGIRFSGQSEMPVQLGGTLRAHLKPTAANWHGLGGRKGTGPQRRTAAASGATTRAFYGNRVRPARLKPFKRTTAYFASPGFDRQLLSDSPSRRVHQALSQRGRGIFLRRVDALGFVDNDAAESLATIRAYAASAVRSQGQRCGEAARAAIKTAGERHAEGDHNAARAGFVRACFLDQAAVNFGYSSRQIAGEALAALEKIHRQRVAAWVEQQPGLGEVLDFVVRNRSIDQALQQVGNSIDLKIQLVPGSLEDAARLKHEDVRVRYLDLRGATVAQALDWILWPAGLRWRLENDAIVAGADRRLPGQSAWVYDVSHIAIPSDEAMARHQDADQATAAAQRAADDFIRVVRDVLKVEAELDVAWFAAGQLVVLGPPVRHELAARLFFNLADPHRKVRLEGDAGKLQLVTAKRAKEHKGLEAKLSAARHRARIARSHAAFGWQLLAAAADGRLDGEALTELSIAWNDPATSALLAGDGRSLAMRSLWVVTESSRALPDEPQLANLVENARKLSGRCVTNAMKRVDKNAEDDDSFATLLYAALAMRDDADVRARALKLLRTDAEQASPSPAHLVAESLLKDRDHLDQGALSDLASNGVSGEDLTVLTALACRRAGGEAWQTFRAEAHELIGSQPLPGHTIVLIHRLSQNRLPVTSELP